MNRNRLALALALGTALAAWTMYALRPKEQEKTRTMFEVTARIGYARVYADLNGNEVFDAGEPFAVTARNGTATISNLPQGQYTLRIDSNSIAPATLPFLKMRLNQ